MKTTGFLSFSLLAVLIIGGMSFNSCKKDEVKPVPEIVENPLEKEIYHIMGKVTDGKNPLADVTVTVGTVSAKTDVAGVYQIDVNKKGAFSTKVAKEGYITIESEVTIGSNANKGTTVLLSQILTKRADPVTAYSDKETGFAVNEEIDVKIPASAVKTDTDVTMTSYVPAANEEVRNATEKLLNSGAAAPVSIITSVSLSSLHCEPGGLKFGKPTEVKLKAVNPTLGLFIKDMKHFENGQEIEEAVFDANDHSYVIMLDGFSVHEKRTSADIAIEAESQMIYSEVIDNIGNPASASKKITYKVQLGWRVVSKSAGVTGDIEWKLMKVLRNKLAIEEGISETEVSKEVAVSGDVKMTIAVEQSLVQYTVQVETSAGPENIVAKSYSNIKPSVTKEQGNMTPEHN